MQNPDIIIVLSLLGTITVLFVSNIISIDIVAICIIIVVGLFKLLPISQLFSGFASEAVISLVAIMIISKGLENTGISIAVAKWLLHISKKQPKKILFLLITISGILAGFMRSMGTVALLLPVASKLAKRAEISKSYLLLPMAFCTILGGMLTMIGTAPLILLNSLLQSTNNSTNNFSLFTVMPIGLALLVVGIIYLMLVSNKYLKHIPLKAKEKKSQQEYFRKIYGKGGKLFEIKITNNHIFTGKKLDSIENSMPDDISIIGVMQNNKAIIPPLRNIVIKSNDKIAILGTTKDIEEYCNENKLKYLSKDGTLHDILKKKNAGVCEAVIPPQSNLIGEDVKDLRIRRNYGLQILALSRDNNIYQGKELQKLTLRAGDTLGMYSQWQNLYDLAKNPNFFVLTNIYKYAKIQPYKIKLAILSFFFSIFLVIFVKFNLALSLMIGACGMIITGVVSIEEAYNTINWKTIFFLAGMIPLGIVIQTSGCANWIIQTMEPYILWLPVWGAQLLLVIAATILALIISNIGATVVLVPLALDLATNYNIAPELFALTVALAASNTFIIPTHQVNALICGPGNYSRYDFLTIGSGMSVIFIVVVMLCLQFMY